MSAKRIDRKIDLEAGTVTFTVVATGETLVADQSKLPSDMHMRAVLAGLNAKVGDSAADPNVDAFTQMTAIRDQLEAGNWNARGGDGGASRVTLLAEAMFAVQKGDLTLDDMVDRLDAMTKEQRKAIPLTYVKVKSAMEEIKAKRASEKAKVAKKAAAGDQSDIDELFA